MAGTTRRAAVGRSRFCCSVVAELLVGAMADGGRSLLQMINILGLPSFPLFVQTLHGPSDVPKTNDDQQSGHVASGESFRYWAQVVVSCDPFDVVGGGWWVESLTGELPMTPRPSEILCPSPLVSFGLDHHEVQNILMLKIGTLHQVNLQVG
jgi:hypothetical protein